MGCKSKENIYSALPCPRLWSSSLGLLAILFPINVISEVKISPALLNASAIIALLLVIKPIVPFIISKKRFPIIPKILAVFNLLLFIISPLFVRTF